MSNFIFLLVFSLLFFTVQVQTKENIIQYIKNNSYLSDIEVNKIYNSVYKWSKITGIDPLLIFSIITHESSFNPGAVGRDGEKGLMQIMPIALEQTVKTYSIKNDPTLLFDIDYNIMIGTHYLKYCYSRAKSWNLALAYYNDGFRIRQKGLTYMDRVLSIYKDLKRM